MSIITQETVPFQHVVIDDVFNEDFVEYLTREFNERLNRGLREDSHVIHGVFHKSHNWPAYFYHFDPENDDFSKFFFNHEFKDFINGFFNLPLNNNMMGQFHHHQPQNKSGFVHNDFDTTSWLNEPLPNGINPHRHKIYLFGRQADAQEYCIRSIALIYYFNNTDDPIGGETALYHEKTGEPAKLITPKNNRLLAFKVSPSSWHNFIATQTVRNSMVCWFHCSDDYMLGNYPNFWSN